MLFHIAARLAFCPALPAKTACVGPPCFSKETNYTKSRTSSGNIELKATAGSMSSSSKILLKMWLQKQKGTLYRVNACMHHPLAPRPALPKGQHYRSTNPRRPWSQVNAEITPPTLSTQNAKNAAARRPRCCGFAIEGRDLRRKPAVPWPLTICHCQRTRCPGPPPIGNDIIGSSITAAILICWAVFKLLSLDCSFLFDIVFLLERLYCVERSNDQRVFCKNATPHLVHFVLA